MAGSPEFEPGNDGRLGDFSLSFSFTASAERDAMAEGHSGRGKEPCLKEKERENPPNLPSFPGLNSGVAVHS